MTTLDNEIKFACPHCGQHLIVETRMYGEECECPACGEVLSVPNPDNEERQSDEDDQESLQCEGKTECPQKETTTHEGSDYKDGAILPATAAMTKTVATKDKLVTCWKRCKKGCQMFFSNTKAAAITAKDKTITLWKGGTKGKLIIVGIMVVLLLVLTLLFKSDGKMTSQTRDLASLLVASSTERSWDVKSLREKYSKPMSPDQEVYNNLLYLYLSMENHYSKYGDVKKKVFEFDHSRLSPDMKDFVARFVSFLDKIGETERRINYNQEDSKKERDDSSLTSGLAGGFKAAATLSQFDDGDVSAGTYLLAGLIGGLIETSENDAKIKKRYERVVKEYRMQEESLYIGFKQDINRLRNSDVYATFDKERLLSENAVASFYSLGTTEKKATKFLQFVQYRVPELECIDFIASFGTSLRDIKSIGELKQNLSIFIANYPQSLEDSRKKNIAVYYTLLGIVAVFDNIVRKSPEMANEPGWTDRMNTYMDSIATDEFALIASDSIAILTEGIKCDSSNDFAVSLRADLQFRSGDYQRALTDINNAININPKESYYYNKACILAKGFSDTQGAKDAIREALKKGFRDITKLKSDKNFVILKDDPEFIRLVETIK